MGGVKVPIVQVVDMVAVGDGHVSAVGAVNVLVMRVLHTFVQVARVPVILVTVVKMAVVHVVDMVAVGDRHVPAVGPVNVRVFGVGPMLHVPSMSFVPTPGSSFCSEVVSNGA